MRILTSQVCCSSCFLGCFDHVIGHSHSHSHGESGHAHAHSSLPGRQVQSTGQQNARLPTESDMEKLRSTIKQFVRDWSEEVTRVEYTLYS